MPITLVIGLGACLILALLTRLPGLEFGVPDLWHPDEQRLIYNPAKRFAAGEGLGLPRWPYPPLMAELVGIVLRVFPYDPPTLRAIAVGRGISAGLGIVGVLATALAAWTATRRVGPTLVAGGLVAFAPIAIQLGHYATPDGAALGCVGLALWASARALDGPDEREASRPWALLGIGAATGLAAAFKYNAAMIAVLAIAATASRIAARLSSDADASIQARLRVAAIECGWLLAAGLVAIGVFVASLVPVWSELGDLERGLRQEWEHYRHTGHIGFTTESAAADALVNLWGAGIGGPALLVSLAIPLLRERSRALAASALLMSLAYLLLLAPQQVFFDRVVFVLIPPLALVAGLAGDALVERGAAWASERWPAHQRRLSIGLPSLAVAALLVVPAWRGGLMVRALTTPDTRAQSRDYLLGVTDAESKVLHMPRDLYLAPTISGRENIRLDPRMGPRRSLARRPDYVVFVDGYWERFSNNPIGSANLRKRERAWRKALDRRYDIAEVFEGPSLPCRGCPGTTISAYHHPKVTVYVRRSSSK